MKKFLILTAAFASIFSLVVAQQYTPLVPFSQLQFTGIGSVSALALHTIFVSGSGNDSTGMRLDPSHPFLTITAARAVAQPGDTIIVYPGTYVENDLLKVGVNYAGIGWPTLSWTMSDVGVTNSRGIFDDRWTGATTNIISGFNFFCSNGTNDYNPFTSKVGSSNSLGGIVITNPLSKMAISGDKYIMESYDVNFNAFLISNCREIHIDFDELDDIRGGAPITVDFIDPEEGPSTFTSQPFGAGILWSEGECYARIRYIGKVGQYSLWPEEPGVGSHTNNFWFTGDLIKQKIYVLAHSLTYRTWIDVKEVQVLFVNNPGAAVDVYGGKFYLRAMKVSHINGPLAMNAGSTGNNCEAWFDVQKVSAYKSGLLVNESGGGTTAVWANIGHFEDAGGATNFVMMTGGTLFLKGQQMKMTNGTGIYFTGGQANVEGYTIDTKTTDNVLNRPVVVTANGLVLSGSTKLIAPASADSVYSPTAKNVGNYGVIVATKAKNANITITPGAAIIVDSSVR